MFFLALTSFFNRWPPGGAVSTATAFHVPWFHAAQWLYSGCWLFVNVWMDCSSVSVSVSVRVWVNGRLSVCVFIDKKKKKPTQWSYLIWSEFGSTLIGNDRKFACEPSWRWAAGKPTNSRASTLDVVVRGDELIRYTSSMWVWVYLKSHGGQWV